jgi:hypothetical protein
MRKIIYNEETLLERDVQTWLYKKKLNHVSEKKLINFT